MNICILDGREIKDRRMLHDALAVSLGFPDWYGRNLDALYDCLTDMREDTEIQLLHESVMEEYLGEYAESLAKVIYMAAEINPKIKWKIGEIDGVRHGTP